MKNSVGDPCDMRVRRYRSRHALYSAASEQFFIDLRMKNAPHVRMMLPIIGRFRLSPTNAVQYLLVGYLTVCVEDHSDQ
jgi:hypothetical protein